MQEDDFAALSATLGAPNPAPEPTNPEPEPPAPDQPQAPAEPPAPEAPPAAPERPEPGFVPLQTTLDERQKRQEAERRAQEAERRLQELEQQRQAPQPPSLYDDAEGFQRHLEERIANQERQVRFEMSERFANQAHGEETVKAALEWGLTQPQPIVAGYISGADPVGQVVADYKRSQLLQQIGDDPDAYVRRRAAELGLAISAPQPPPGQPLATPQSPGPTPPRSLAAAPSAGAQPPAVQQQKVGPVAALDALPT